MCSLKQDTAFSQTAGKAMKGRDFETCSLLLLAPPAQQLERRRRVGEHFSEHDLRSQVCVAAFPTKLGKLGWTISNNLQ
jgi:hypothetical protein